jgi:hypothetical protein
MPPSCVKVYQRESIDSSSSANAAMRDVEIVLRELTQ